MTERLLMICLMVICLLIPWWIERRQGIFSPLRTYSILGFITTIPYLVLLSFDPSLMNYAVAYNIEHDELDDVFIKYAFVQSLAYLCVIGGYLYARRLPFCRFPKAASPYVSNKSIVTAAFVALLIGMVFWVIKVQQAGGLMNILLNLDDRASLTAGSGYVSAVAEVLLSFSVLLLIYSFQYGGRLSKKACVAIFFIITAIAYASFGGRKHLIQLILMVLLTWHFNVKKIESVKFTHIAIVFFLVFYFIGALLLRQEGAVEFYLAQPGAFLTSVIDNLGTFFTNISYADTYMFIIKYFDENGYWWGRSFGDLLYAPIPSTVMLDKPPVDDGVYIRSLADGMSVSPPTPFKRMFPSSWPPETIGNGYANAGVLGVVVGMFLLGVIYRSAYAFMISRRTFFSFYIFLMVLLNFQLTNLRIVQFLTNAAIAGIFCWLFCSGRKIKPI